jgi:hypothetical protein
MNYNVITLPFFSSQLKRLVKKYPSFRAEYASLIARLEKEPEQGTHLA